mmetsp:Transcript_14770/g.36161  ORF Transcript_14770/g.36161 Transcript_14770/m.36161 type:complete len:365 (-) Transcript_14770:898-1992(-)
MAPSLLGPARPSVRHTGTSAAAAVVVAVVAAAAVVNAASSPWVRMPWGIRSSTPPALTPSPRAKAMLTSPAPRGPPSAAPRAQAGTRSLCDSSPSRFPSLVPSPKAASPSAATVPASGPSPIVCPAAAASSSASRAPRVASPPACCVSAVARALYASRCRSAALATLGWCASSAADDTSLFCSRCAATPAATLAATAPGPRALADAASVPGTAAPLLSVGAAQAGKLNSSVGRFPESPAVASLFCAPGSAAPSAASTRSPFLLPPLSSSSAAASSAGSSAKSGSSWRLGISYSYGSLSHTCAGATVGSTSFLRSFRSGVSGTVQRCRCGDASLSCGAARNMGSGWLYWTCVGVTDCCCCCCCCC